MRLPFQPLKANAEPETEEVKWPTVSFEHTMAKTIAKKKKKKKDADGDFDGSMSEDD